MGVRKVKSKVDQQSQKEYMIAVKRVRRKTYTGESYSQESITRTKQSFQPFQGNKERRREASPSARIPQLTTLL